MKAREVAKTPPAWVETADDIPDDVRAELDREARLTGSRTPPAESPLEIPDDVRAEHAASERALVEEPGNDATRLAPVENDSSG